MKQRQYDQPPTDCLAEASALAAVLDDPQLMHTLDLGPLLVGFPEHRICWQAMVRVHMRGGWLRPLPPAEHRDEREGEIYAHLWEGLCFFWAWRRDLCQHECSRPPQQPQHEFWVPGRCRARSLWHSLELAHNSSGKPLDQWLDRLRGCVDARRMISAAQEIAERAWRVPDQSFSLSDAWAVLERLGPRPRPSLADRVFTV